MAIDINAILQTLQTGIENLAKTSLANYITQAKSDGMDTLNAMKSNLQDWATQAAQGQLSAPDLNFLVQGQADLVKITALTQAGVAQIQLDQFKQGVITLIVNTISGLIKV
jgi:hypothetical protein